MADAKIRVRYFGLIRNVVGRQDDEVPADGLMTVRQVLEALVERHGEGFRDAVLAGGGLLRPTALVFLNGKDIAKLGGIDVLLDRDDEVSVAVVTHALGGG
ncbi:MAG: MoaD/ThiS family protein [Chloroflexi bacterium]|nr:MoaD/ThiS family protein [Chloroflexota bacterium]